MSTIGSGLTSSRKLIPQIYLIDALRLLTYYVLGWFYLVPTQIRYNLAFVYNCGHFVKLLILGNNWLSMIKFIKCYCGSWFKIYYYLKSVKSFCDYYSQWQTFRNLLSISKFWFIIYTFSVLYIYLIKIWLYYWFYYLNT